MLYKRGRRDRHDIVAEILESARGGAIKTHIMYKARLSYAQLNDYLTSLVDKGFLESLMTVENRQTKRLFKTSEAGEEFIKSFRTLDV
jgi:predicted transcriptional regulator